MTKQGDETVAEIGSFKRPQEPQQDVHDDRLVPPGVGQRAIQDFIQGRTSVQVEDVDNSVKPETTPKDAPAKQAKQDTSSDPKAREEQLLRAMQEIEESPEMTYDQKLAKHELTKEKAMQIVDNMFTHGYHEETYPVAGTVTITLRTRKTDDQDRLLRRLEAEGPQYPATVSNFVSKYNLAASMRRFKDKTFGDDVEFKDRYNFVSNLPDTVFRLLCVKLAKFDEMILDVLDEGAIANF